MSAPESEISNIATVTIDKLNDKDEVVETEELKFEVVDESTKNWQHTFWNRQQNKTCSDHNVVE